MQAVRAYDATPEWLSKAIGYGLPVLELCIGALLIVGVVVRLAAIVSTALFAVFLVGVLQAAARGIKLECGCFGGGGTTTSTTYTLDVLRDVGLWCSAVYLIVWPLTRWSVDEYLARNDFVAPPSAKRMRTGQGARKYNAMLEARRKAARERTLYLSASLSVLIVLISIVGIGVQANRAKIQGDLTATNATATNGVTVRQGREGDGGLLRGLPVPDLLTRSSRAWAATSRPRSRLAGFRPSTTRCRSSTRPRTATDTPRVPRTRRYARPT